MLFATIIVVVLILIFVVNFVVTNVEMFQSSFDIVIGFPFIERWSYTIEDIKFIYIVGGSVLLGALVIVIGTWVLDTKRKITFLRMKKELKRLQQAIKEAKSSLPPETQSSEGTSSAAEGEPSEFIDSSTVTPEEITKSFEDTVQQSDVLDETKELSPEPENVPERETVTKSEESPVEREPSSYDTDKSLPQKTAIEAELVENDEPSEEEHLSEEKRRQEEKE